MKTRIVLAGLMATVMVLEVSAQRAEYDDMYFRSKDREKNKAIEAQAYVAAQTKQQKIEQAEQEYASNPTDSYSSRNVNPEYVSRSNSEQASEDETNYYVEGYTPSSATTNNNFNNSYYNNANWARNSYYANTGWNSSFYNGWGMSPYGNYYNSYDPWMSGYGYGYPSYGWRSGWSVSIGYGNYWGPNYGYGYGYGSPYYYGGYGYGGYGYGGYGYPNYYYSGNYYEGSNSVNYGKRPSRSSATLRPSTGSGRNNVSVPSGNGSTVSNGRATRVRQARDEYYVRPSQRTSSPSFDTPTQRSSGSNWSTPSNSQPTRARETFSTPSRSPSYTPSSSPSRGSSGGGSSGGGGSSPRRGRS